MQRLLDPPGHGSTQPAKPPNTYLPAGLPNAKEGAVVPPVVAPEVPPAPAPPNSEGFAAPASPPVFPNEKPPEAGCDAPGVACGFPNRLGLAAAGVLEPPPKSADPEPVVPPPNREGAAAGVLEPEFALVFAPPKRLDVPGVAAPPNRGLFGVLLLLLLLPKLKDMVRELAGVPGVL